MKIRRARRILAPTLVGVGVLARTFTISQADGALGLLCQVVGWGAFDLRTRARLDRHAGQHPRVVVVDIDEPSLRVEGHSPWGREKIAALVDRLFDWVPFGIR